MKRRAVVAGGVFAVALIGLLAGKRYAGSGDTVPAEYQPIALLTTGRLDFTALFAAGAPCQEWWRTERRPCAMTFAGQMLPYPFRLVSGRVVSVYPILTGLLNVPAFAAARLAGVDIVAHRLGLSHLTAAGLAAASAAALFLALSQVSRERVAVGLTLVYVFATEVFSVAGRGLWQHGGGLFFISLALALLLAERPLATALAGGALALAVAARPTNLLLALPLAAFVLRHRPRVAPAFAVAAGIPAALLFAYSSAYLGNPLGMGQLQGAAGFHGRPWVALPGLLLSPSRGLIVFGPFLLFAVPLLLRPPGPAASRPLLAHAALFVPLLLLCVSFWSNWWGGQSFGYRLLTELLPVLMLLIAASWDERIGPFPARRRLFGAGVVFAAGLHALGAFVPTDFNSRPVSVDAQPARLWDFLDSEPARALRRLVARLASADDERTRLSPPSA